MREAAPHQLLVWLGMLLVCFETGEFARAGSNSPRKEKRTMTITSSAFANAKPIPTRYTCQGEDVSPPLQWDVPPPGTKSLALICDDPDAPAGTWVHWVIYHLPSDTTKLDAGVPPQPTLSNGARQGQNDFQRIGYGGPCPPPGGPHRYFFKLYALDADLALPPGAAKTDLVRAMKGHILAEGQLMGTYQRR